MSGSIHELIYIEVSFILNFSGGFLRYEKIWWLILERKLIGIDLRVEAVADTELKSKISLKTHFWGLKTITTH
jgi:hypothetical protein